jgi:hypothetical protein
VPIFSNLDHQRIVESDFLFYGDGGANAGEIDRLAPI